MKTIKSVLENLSYEQNKAEFISPTSSVDDIGVFSELIDQALNDIESIIKEQVIGEDVKRGKFVTDSPRERSYDTYENVIKKEQRANLLKALGRGGK